MKFKIVEYLNGHGKSIFRIKKKCFMFFWWYHTTMTRGGEDIVEYNSREEAVAAVMDMQTPDPDTQRIEV